MKHIDQEPEYRAVADPLKGLNREIADARRRLDEITLELSRVNTSQEGQSAWATYLQDGSEASSTRAALREEGRKLEERLVLLNKARDEGNAQVTIAQARLSREPCKSARPAIVAEIRKINEALDQIAAANARIGGIREEIEALGYKTSALPVAELSLSGRDVSWRTYIATNFPEMK